MIPEREQWDGDRDGAPGGQYPGRPPLFERKQTFAAIAPFVVIATVLYGMSGLGTGTANDLVATGCFLGALVVAVAWLKHIAIPFVAKGRVVSGLTIQDAIALQRERRER